MLFPPTPLFNFSFPRFHTLAAARVSQVGGGIRLDNAAQYLQAGASHVIVTSYVFREGKLDWERLKALAREVGPERLVLDLSCRKKDGVYKCVGGGRSERRSRSRGVRVTWCT